MTQGLFHITHAQGFVQHSRSAQKTATGTHRTGIRASHLVRAIAIVADEDGYDQVPSP
jgi:hypothetical protein